MFNKSEIEQIKSIKREIFNAITEKRVNQIVKESYGDYTLVIHSDMEYLTIIIKDSNGLAMIYADIKEFMTKTHIDTINYLNSVLYYNYQSTEYEYEMRKKGY